MQINTCAPAKTILFGEHYVVYGACGIAAAIEPYNIMQVIFEKQQTGSLQYFSTIKKMNLNINAQCFDKKIEHPIHAMYDYYCKKYTQTNNLKISANVKKVWELKGVGNSASLCACFSYAMRKANAVSNTAQEIFEDVEVGEKVAHGSPSGIDAGAVCFGGAIEFKKMFTQKPKITKMQIHTDLEHTFFLVDTYKKDKKRSNTKDMIDTFAKQNGIDKTLDQMEQKEREQICKPYTPIFDMAKKAFAQCDMKLLATAMQKNHALLSKSGVCSQSIEDVVQICKDNGALGAKVSSAGGYGGAVVGICKKQEYTQIAESLEENGFAIHKFKIADKGVHEV